MNGIEVECHTEDQALLELCRRYWAFDADGKFHDSVSALAAAFNVPVSKVATVVNAHSKAFDQSDPCSKCGGPYFLTSRTTYQERRRRRNWDAWACARCRETERISRELEAQQKRRRTFELITLELERKKSHGLSINELSFRDMVYLVSLLRAGGSEDLSTIAPLESFPRQLSPTSEQDRKIVDHLYRRNVICIHPGSHQDSVVISDDEVREFYPAKVNWVLPIVDDGPSPVHILESLEDQLNWQDWPESWCAEAAQLHRDVALAECLQYLRIVLAEHQFEAKFGEKTCLVLRAVLTKFSIGQTYTFIWRAARDAASFYLRERASKAHAANIVPGAIQKMAERAIAEGWSTFSFRRDFRAPLSVLSQVLFSTALRLPEDGFTTVPPAENTLTTSPN
jgi:hypothetical protein